MLVHLHRKCWWMFVKHQDTTYSNFSERRTSHMAVLCCHKQKNTVKHEAREFSDLTPISETLSTHQLRPGSCCSMKLWWTFRWSPGRSVKKHTEITGSFSVVVPCFWCFFLFGEMIKAQQKHSCMATWKFRRPFRGLRNFLWPCPGLSSRCTGPSKQSMWR